MARIRQLLNGALTEPFTPYREDKQRTTAVGWAPWWLPAQKDAPSWQNRVPVFGAITLDGRPVQQLSTPYGTHVAGLWQQAPAAAGNRYELTVEGQAWSSEDAEPASRLEASDVNLQIGLDPTGGLDPESPLIVWSEPAQPLSHWETLHLTAEAESSIISIFLKSAPKLPKRQQSTFWRNARLHPLGRYKRSINIIGIGDTYISLEPERPLPGEMVTAIVSSTRQHPYADLLVTNPENRRASATFLGTGVDEDRTIWRYEFDPALEGLYDIRFVGDDGARLLALRLLRVARDVQLVPSDAARTNYQRVYVLLPPTADAKWFAAAARGSFHGRYTIGFSADDAGIGDLESRQVLAVNPHHWPEVLTAAWFRQHYPGVQFTAVLANTPEDLESWLKNWDGSA
ncbi:MAG: hypothetical protein ACE5E7_04780 [Anaerolineae bacterium]